MAQMETGDDIPANAPFDFIGTPDEAWLLVGLAALEKVNIAPDQLSLQTRRSRVHVYALCEDIDAKIFMDRWQARYGIINIRENVLCPSVLSDWPCLNSFHHGGQS